MNGTASGSAADRRPRFTKFLNTADYRLAVQVTESRGEQGSTLATASEKQGEEWALHCANLSYRLWCTSCLLPHVAEHVRRGAEVQVHDHPKWNSRLSWGAHARTHRLHRRPRDGLDDSRSHPSRRKQIIPLDLSLSRSPCSPALCTPTPQRSLWATADSFGSSDDPGKLRYSWHQSQHTETDSNGPRKREVTPKPRTRWGWQQTVVARRGVQHITYCLRTYLYCTSPSAVSAECIKSQARGSSPVSQAALPSTTYLR